MTALPVPPPLPHGHPHSRPPLPLYTPPRQPPSLHACTGCSHRRPDPPLTGWRLLRRIGLITGLVLLGITVLLGLLGWAALFVAL